MVSKATYTAWEAEVIAAFFTAEKPRTALIPVDGAPAVLSKEKYVLAVVPAGAADAVAAGKAAGLAASQPSSCGTSASRRPTACASASTTAYTSTRRATSAG